MDVTSPLSSYWPTVPSFGKWAYTAIPLYLLAVRLLRYQNVRRMERKYGKEDKLTPAQAQDIINTTFYYEVPWINKQAHAFALFKTYGIPTISKLLMKTKQLSKKEYSSKRYMDTAILVSTWTSCPISGPGSGASNIQDAAPDPRNAIAVARMNWLHSHYSISNDDYLYTLSRFVCEPVIWCKKFSWRSLTDLECKAIYTYWAEIGARMGIKDIPRSFEELQEWGENYEQEYMVPDENNAGVAEQTILLVLHGVPAFLHPFGRQVVSCLLEDRLRKSMMIPAPSPLLQKAVHGALHLRAFMIRNFFLPRFQPAPSILDNDLKLSVKKDKNTLIRSHPLVYDNYPWYYPESTGLKKLYENILVALGLARREDLPGPHFQSEGYRLEEIGPKVFMKLDHEKIMKMAEEMQGAPVTGPFSLDYKGGCLMQG